MSALASPPQALPPPPSSLPRPRRKPVPVPPSPLGTSRQNENRAPNRQAQAHRRAQASSSSSDPEIRTDNSWVSFNSTTGGGRESPTFISTTDHSFDAEATRALEDTGTPTHRTFIRTPQGSQANNTAPDDRFGETTLFDDVEFAEAAFTLEGREEVEVSRLELDSSRDAAAADPPVGGGGEISNSAPGASPRSDWGSVATWMRTPIEAIMGAAPVVPPESQNEGASANNNSDTTGSADQGINGISTPERRPTSSATPPQSLPPRPRANTSSGTPTIRPPRPAPSSAPRPSNRTNAASASSNASNSSDEEVGQNGGARTATTPRGRRTRRTGIPQNAGGGRSRSRSISDRLRGRSRSASVSHRGGSGDTGNRGRANSVSRAPTTPTSTRSQNTSTGRGRSTSRPRQATRSSSGSEGRGRSTSRPRQPGPTAPSSGGTRGRSRSVNRAGSRVSSGTRTSRSMSRTRTSAPPTPNRSTRGRSSSRTRTPQRMPASPAGSAPSLSRSSARTPQRLSNPTSPSASSTGGLSRRAVPASNIWANDLDNASVASEPSGNIGRPTYNRRTNSNMSSSSGSRRVTSEGLQSLGRSNSFDAANPTGSSSNGTRRRPSMTSSRREGGIMEKLFGDTVSTEARRSYLPSRNQNMSSNVSTTSGSSAAAQPEAVHTRTLLTASVYHNQATNLWIATINTNQKQHATNRKNAAKYLKAFSFHTEREARESAYANAPPKMILFDDSPNCFICRGKFALFRRPSHCRNCGVCICGSCSTTWSSKMIPETYNMKNESNVKVCKSCNFLVLAFRRALLDGQYDEAIALYNTGNINLRCPFTNVKGGEVMFPIHCATEGGNLDLLRWLVDVHYCPISLVRTGNKKQDRGNNHPILTSKSRSCLNIAMQGQKVDTMRYLIIEKAISVYEIKDIKTSLGALEAVLNAFPRAVTSEYDLPTIGDDPINFDLNNDINMFEDSPEFDTESNVSDDELSTTSRNARVIPDIQEMDSVSTTVADACIICYENSIDCVITPCGHQICCLECSANLETCPVCNSQGQFIRIFKP